MELPEELKPLFNDSHFASYPFVKIPQEFHDSRGSILNIADGVLGDVAVIYNSPGSIRANHYHETDWHLSFLLNGSMTYRWRSLDSTDKGEIKLTPGELIFTPSGIIHQMLFSERATFIAISKLSRSQVNYESDTKRVSFSLLDPQS